MPRGFPKVGRLTLIRSIMCVIPIYFFSLFRAPSEVCKNIEKLLHIFLWEGVDEGKGKALGQMGDHIEIDHFRGLRNWELRFQQSIISQMVVAFLP